MDENQEQPKKKKWIKKWTPRQFALFLAAHDLRYVLPVTDAQTILNEVPNVHCGVEKIDRLRASPEFHRAVEGIFNNKIRSQYSVETWFWYYLKKCYQANMNAEKPSEKILDILGYLSDIYAPHSKKKESPKSKMSPEQIAKLIHQREQANATLNSAKEPKDGENGE